MLNPLTPADWPIALDDLPDQTYLVGGSVRDALRGQVQSDLDLDFVTPGPAIPLAQQLAHKYQASFVILDAQRSIARLVFPQATVDIAQQMGETLETDLARRDFTINAIAYDPHTDQIIDPLNGYGDLQAQRLQMIALENLAADPLRVLRAYRQASQLRFTITPPTRHGLQTIAPHLATVAPERIRTELSYLLASPCGHGYLGWAWEDGALAHWLPQLNQANLTVLGNLETWITASPPLWPGLAPYLAQPLLPNPGPGEPRKRTLLTVTKLAALFWKNSTPEQSRHILNRLTYSNREIKLIQTLLQALTDLPPALMPRARSQQFFLFKQVGLAWPGLMLLGIATGLDRERLTDLTQAWLDPNHPIAHPPCLLTGADLLETFGLRPGPDIGQILQQVETAQATGELTTPEAAQAWVRDYLHTKSIN